jgi:dynein heavy chain
MTGALQTHARQHRIAIDKLAFGFEILEAEGPDDLDETPPEDGCQITGLHIAGARWDRENHCLAEPRPSRMTETMPVIWFKPQEDYRPDPDEYLAPLYKTSVRAGVLSTTGQSTNFVVHVATQTREPTIHWVLRAAALLCMPD